MPDDRHHHDDDNNGQGHRDSPRHDGLLQQWTAPPTVIALVVAVATVYGSWILQTERIETLRSQVRSIEQGYAQKEVLSEQLRSINDRLYRIEQTIRDDRSPLVR